MYTENFILILICSVEYQAKYVIFSSVHKAARSYDDIELPEDREEKGTVDYTGKFLIRCIPMATNFIDKT